MLDERREHEPSVPVLDVLEMVEAGCQAQRALAGGVDQGYGVVRGAGTVEADVVLPPVAEVVRGAGYGLSGLVDDAVHEPRALQAFIDSSS